MGAAERHDPMSGLAQQPEQPESPKQTWEDQVFEAEIADIEAQTANRNLEAEDKSYQLRAEIELDKAEAEDKRSKQQADIHDQETRTNRGLDLAEEKAKAENTDQELWSAAKLDDFRLRSRTDQVERYFFMCVLAIGIIAAIVLAAISADQSTAAYRLSPLTGLLISGGSGLKLRSLTRSQGRDETETGSSGREEDRGQGRG